MYKVKKILWNLLLLIIRLRMLAFALTGAGLLVYGVSLIYRPAGFICAGCLMLAEIASLNVKRSTK